jgi:hypothetical protein
MLLLERAVPLNTASLVEALQQRHSEMGYKFVVPAPTEHSPPRKSRLWGALTGRTAPSHRDSAKTQRPEPTFGRVQGRSQQEPPKQSSVIIWNAAGRAVAVMEIPRPLPDGTQEIAARCKQWPDAVSACAAHRAHVIISVIGSDGDPISEARATTAVAGAYAATHAGVIGGLWNTKVLNDAATWKELSKRAFSANADLPAFLWVSMHPFRLRDEAGCGVFTQGLDIFIQHELELVAPAHQYEVLLSRANGLVKYLLQRGKSIDDGHTFGISETERFAVYHRRSRRFAPTPVLYATLDELMVDPDPADAIEDEFRKLKEFLEKGIYSKTPIISDALANSDPILRMLGRNMDAAGAPLFAVYQSINMLYLPSTRDTAVKLGMKSYCGAPMASFVKGIADHLVQMRLGNLVGGI